MANYLTTANCKAILLYIATGHRRIDLAEFKTQTITSKVHSDKILGNIWQIL